MLPTWQLYFLIAFWESLIQPYLAILIYKIVGNNTICINNTICVNNTICINNTSPIHFAHAPVHNKIFLALIFSPSSLSFFLSLSFSLYLSISFYLSLFFSFVLRHFLLQRQHLDHNIQFTENSWQIIDTHFCEWVST